MKVTTEIIDLNDFNAWSGAEDTKKTICDAGKGVAFMDALEDIYPNGYDETALNDLLWFEPEFCLSLVGLKAKK